MPSPTVRREPPLPGTLVVNWKPWASVRIDNQPEKSTPCTFEGLSGGPLEVEITHPELGALTKTVSIVPGKTVRLVGEFEARAALAINAVPWAEVLVDGAARGSTPLELKLPPGTHEVVLRFPGPPVQEKRILVQLAAGENRALRHQF